MRRLARRLFTLCSAAWLVLMSPGCRRQFGAPAPPAPAATQPAVTTAVAQSDPLSRISDLRRSLPPVARSRLLVSEEHRSAAAELVAYLRHPAREVREAAYVALIGMQPDCPPPDADVWKRWLRQLQEDAEAVVPVSPAPAAPPG